MRDRGSLRVFWVLGIDRRIAGRVDVATQDDDGDTSVILQPEEHIQYLVCLLGVDLGTPGVVDVIPEVADILHEVGVHAAAKRKTAYDLLHEPENVPPCSRNKFLND